MDEPKDAIHVLNVPFTSLGNVAVSLEGSTRYRYRLIDAKALASRSSLRLLEFTELPPEFSTVSYVWTSFNKDSSGTSARITVKGIDGADPMSVEILRLACVASLRLGCRFMWLDGLCIMQYDDLDKNWHIERMYNIYKCCKECIVIPSGLSRLAHLWESTPWIHRAWTLQEAIAPPSAQVLFSWDKGDAVLSSHFPVHIKEIEPGTAALVDMHTLLQLSLTGVHSLSTLSTDGKHSEEEPCQFPIDIMLGQDENRSEIISLLGALNFKDKEGMAHAIWRCAFLRVAKFPVDMVLSIMGIMGVTLDASKYTKDDRQGATVDLLREILRKGGRAEWLGLATQMPLNREFSTLPVFPRMASSGRAVVSVGKKEEEVSSIMTDIWWRIEDAPKGIITEEGYFRFRAPTVAVCRCKSEAHSFETVDSDEAWTLNVEGDHCPATYAVLIGDKERYQDGTWGAFVEEPLKLAMVVNKHGPGKYHNIGYAFVGEGIWTAPGWVVQEIQVGGVAQVYTDKPGIC